MAQLLLVLAIIGGAAYFLLSGRTSTDVQRVQEMQTGESREMQQVRQIEEIQKQAAEAQQQKLDDATRTGESP